MLRKLKITNFALIKSLEIDFSNNFNVVIGETGAGKSIIFDALDFVLGNKADKTMIRSGEDYLKVAALFTDINSVAKKLIEAYDIECCDEILITRTFTMLGKGEIKINGEIITTNMLKKIAEALADHYIQSESIELLKQKNHLSILDGFKYREKEKVIDDLNIIFDELKLLTNQLNELGGDNENRAKEIDLLNYQINEIESANLKADEDIALNDKFLKFSNSEKILENLQKSEYCLNSEQGCLNLLRNVISNFKSIEKYDQNIAKILNNIEDILLSLEDDSQQVNEILNEYAFDEEVFNQLIKRKEHIDLLKQKYGNSINKILEFKNLCVEKLNKLENAEELICEKLKEKNKLLNIAENKFKELSKLRKQHAIELEKAMNDGFKEVGMINSNFKIMFVEKANSIFDISHYSLNALEDVEFLFSANLGESLKPLAKTISGGEMNRFMLIFKEITAEIEGAETLIFDEIDAGISGEIASSVAKKIAKLSKKYQIICITHLPQVASMGDSFYFVSKSSNNNRTETEIKKLNNDETIKQIAILTYGSYDDKKLDVTRELMLKNKHLKLNIE